MQNLHEARSQASTAPELSDRGGKKNGRSNRLEIGSLPLAGRTVLVVEDDCLIAEDFAAMLRDAGAEVTGPAESLPQAVRMAQECEALDCALLDINLQGVAVYPLAIQLRAWRVPLLFLTGADCEDVPEELSEVICINKPTGAARVIHELIALI